MKVIEISHWASSAGERKISLYKSSETPQNPILFIGGVHGDEPEGVTLATATLNWLKETCEQKTTEGKTTLCPWVLIQCLNPDGFAKNERTNDHGVDLNRNYPSRDWSPEAKKPRYNPGPQPASEPEIKALIALIEEIKPRIIIHCHSWEPCIVYAGAPAMNDAKILSEVSGYEMRNDIGYPTPGSLSQYAWVDHKIPVICIEEQEHIALDKVWPNFGEAIKKIFNDHSPRGLA